MRNFSVGDRVVCVDGHWVDSRNGRVESGISYPIAGAIYTIRDIEIDSDWHMWLWLAEIVNAPQMFESGYRIPCFNATSFRRWVDHEFDLSVFHELASLKSRVRHDLAVAGAGVAV